MSSRKNCNWHWTLARIAFHFESGRGLGKQSCKDRWTTGRDCSSNASHWKKSWRVMANPLKVSWTECFSYYGQHSTGSNAWTGQQRVLQTSTLTGAMNWHAGSCGDNLCAASPSWMAFAHNVGLGCTALSTKILRLQTSVLGLLLIAMVISSSMKMAPHRQSFSRHSC